LAAKRIGRSGRRWNRRRHRQWRLTELFKRLEQNGLGDAGRSWVGTGPNQAVTPASLEKAAGADTLDALARETGIARDELLRRLTAELPHDVDELTPQGRIPSVDETSV
jgi:uncharacterized protein YidB (DUF937 family)